eukprot:66694-Amphidinium_carterae.2
MLVGPTLSHKGKVLDVKHHLKVLACHRKLGTANTCQPFRAHTHGDHSRVSCVRKEFWSSVTSTDEPCHHMCNTWHS